MAQGGFLSKKPLCESTHFWCGRVHHAESCDVSSLPAVACVKRAPGNDYNINHAVCA
jgi:hypothetical protein